MKTNFDPRRGPSSDYMSLPIPNGWVEIGVGLAEIGDYYIPYDGGSVKCSTFNWMFNPVRVVKPIKA